MILFPLLFSARPACFLRTSAYVSPFLLTLQMILPGFAPAQAVPSPLAPATTMTLRSQTGLVITTGTLMQQNVGRRIALYREAGLTTNKLTKLEQLHGDLFLARLNGETTRGLEMRRRIGEVLSPEEQATVDGLLRRETVNLRRRLVSPETTVTRTTDGSGSTQ